MHKALKEVQWLIKNCRQNIEGAERKIQTLFDTIEANQLDIAERHELLEELLQVEDAILTSMGESPQEDEGSEDHEQEVHEGVPNKQGINEQV